MILNFEQIESTTYVQNIFSISY